MVDVGEAPVEAAKGDSAEELGLEVQVGPLMAEVTVVRADSAFHDSCTAGRRESVACSARGRVKSARSHRAQGT
jgi:hypothetical protein